MQNRYSSHTQTLLLNGKITRNRGQWSDPRVPRIHLGHLPARWEMHLPENAATQQRGNLFVHASVDLSPSAVGIFFNFFFHIQSLII